MSTSFCRYGPGWWYRQCWKEEEEGRGRHLTPSIWFSHLQDARKCVGVEQEWSGPRKGDVAVKCGRFVAKTAKGPAPWLQLLHWDSSWVKPKRKKKRWHRIEVSSNPISLPDSKICVSFESLTGFSCCCLEDLGLECEDCSWLLSLMGFLGTPLTSISWVEQSF